ncbi:MAG: hypothetical protein AAFU85_19460 [Planctomycetota bacterium]
MLLRPLLVAAVIWMSCSAARAQTFSAQTFAESLSNAAEDSVERVDPKKIPDIESTKVAFRAAAESLRLHLSQTADDENAAAWMRYLAVDEVLAGIDDDVSEAALAKLALKSANRGVGIHPGLEVAAVMAVRDAATALSNSLRFRKRELTTRLLARRLGKLAEEWDKIEAVPSVDENQDLRLVLGLLEKTGQDVPLMTRARALYSHPNLCIAVSGSAIQQAVTRPVDEPTPVRDCILGTRLVGNARLCGDVTAVLLPSVGSVRMQLVMNATVQSQNTGYNGPVRLRTSSQGQVQATRSLTITESGVALEPASSTGTLTSQLNAIEHRLRIVRRIARRKATEQKSLADSIAKRKMLNRVTEGFVEQTDAAVSRPVPDLMAQALPWLQRLGLSEPARLIGSTRHSVYLTSTVRQDEELAAATPAPTVSPLYDAALQVHESLINNTAGAIFAGRTVTRRELVTLAEKAGATLRPDEEQEDFEIDFDPVRPILFEARDGKLRVGIRATRFKQGKSNRKDVFEVSAVYQPLITSDGRIVLERVGETKIDFPTSRSGLGIASKRGAVKDSIADAFPKRLLEQPITIPADAEVPALANQTLSVRQFEANDGWLTIGIGR